MERPIAEILEDMVRHTKNNPKHGFNCACKDNYVGEIRRSLTKDSFQELVLAVSYIQRSGPL